VTSYPEFVLAAVDRAEPDRLVAKGYSVPFTWDEDPATTEITQTVSWKVAGTRSAPINAKTVDVLLSTDGGETWTALASAVPNTGSTDVVLPSTTSSTARIEVKPTDNVFFDVSDADFSIAVSFGLPAD